LDAYSACSTRSAKAAASASPSGDAGDRDAEVQGDLDRPAAGALLLRLVHDHVHERLPGRRVHVGEDLGRDLDQVRVEAPGVPRAEDLRDPRGLVPGDVAQQLVSLADELLVGVLNAVVHHLHEVPGAVGSHVRDAGLAVGRLRGDLLQHRAEGRVRLDRAARHDARAEQRALLAAGDARAHEVDALLAQLSLTAAGVGEVRVAAVDDHVAGFQERGELLDDRVGGAARLHHDDQAPRPFERGHELLGGLGRDELALVPELLDQGVRAGRRPVVQRDRVAVTCEVAGEVAAHHREARHADLG
jgi:hypothetical protein